jgi:hypothetical protein
MRVVVNYIAPTSRLDELFVIPEMVALGVSEDDPNISAESDFDGDTVNNLLELMYNTNPINGADTPVLTAEDEFIANQFAANDVFEVGAALSGDYDGDGIDDLIEIIARSNPANSASLPSAEEKFVAEELAARGVLSIVNTLPAEDIDEDGVSNLIELLFGNDPIDNADFPILTAEEVFVAEQMSSIGTPGYNMADIGPADDFDGDLVSNVVELLSGFDPTSAAAIPVLTLLEVFVVEQLAESGALVVNAPNREPTQDYDNDGISNIAELQYDRNPSNSADVPVLSGLEVRVAQEMAILYDVFGAPAPFNIGPFDDYDSDGVDNIDELNAVSDPTNP